MNLRRYKQINIEYDKIKLILTITVVENKYPYQTYKTYICEHDYRTHDKDTVIEYLMSELNILTSKELYCIYGIIEDYYDQILL